MTTKGFKVAEIFGPTIQGEGPQAGLPCYFVRFGGCDYRCIWCDSMHAVEPARVQKLPWMPEESIVRHLQALEGYADTVVLSGGNPCLHDLEHLITLLHERNFRVSIETQGTKAPIWLQSCDQIVISPKPPSSGMTTDWHQLHEFVDVCGPVEKAMKVVVFDEADLRYAERVVEEFPYIQSFLSVGTDPGATTEAVLVRYRWLAEQVTCNMNFGNTKVLPQLHVLIWGHALGR